MHSYIPLHGPHKARPETVCVSCIISHFEWELGTDTPQGCTRDSVCKQEPYLSKSAHESSQITILYHVVLNLFTPSKTVGESEFTPYILHTI